MSTIRKCSKIKYHVSIRWKNNFSRNIAKTKYPKACFRTSKITARKAGRELMPLNYTSNLGYMLYLLISAIKGVAYMLELTSVCHLSSKFLGHCVFSSAFSSLHPQKKRISLQKPREHKALRPSTPNFKFYSSPPKKISISSRLTGNPSIRRTYRLG